MGFFELRPLIEKPFELLVLERDVHKIAFTGKKLTHPVNFGKDTCFRVQSKVGVGNRPPIRDDRLGAACSPETPGRNLLASNFVFKYGYFTAAKHIGGRDQRPRADAQGRVSGIRL
jgi:hypothetical protein